MAAIVSAKLLADQLALADVLCAGREHMLDPQDLPGRYGRVVHALDHILRAIGGEAVVAGGWAVWRHGYLGRVTQDVDIVVAAENLDELLRVAAGRARDDSDVVELVLANSDLTDAIREHLASVHPRYVERFDCLVARAHDQAER